MVLSCHRYFDWSRSSGTLESLSYPIFPAALQKKYRYPRAALTKEQKLERFALRHGLGVRHLRVYVIDPVGTEFHVFGQPDQRDLGELVLRLPHIRGLQALE